MRATGLSLLVMAVVLGVFAWWGLRTAAGRQRFDEMDGMYPFFAGIAAAAFILVSVALLLVDFIRARKRQGG